MCTSCVGEHGRLELSSGFDSTEVTSQMPVSTHLYPSLIRQTSFRRFWSFLVGEANIAATQESRSSIAFSNGESDTFGVLPPLAFTIENHL